MQANSDSGRESVVPSLVKSFENLFPLFSRDTGTVVPHFHHKTVVSAIDANVDFFCGETQSVRQQVAYDFGQRLPVGDLHQAIRDLFDQTDAPLLCRGTKHSQLLPDELADIADIVAESVFVRIDLSEIEQLVDQRMKPVVILLDNSQILSASEIRCDFMTCSSGPIIRLKGVRISWVILVKKLMRCS